MRKFNLGPKDHYLRTTPLAILPINTRARIQLERMGVRCLGDLALIAEAELRASGQIGATSLERLRVLLRSVAMDFAELTMPTEPNPSCSTPNAPTPTSEPFDNMHDGHISAPRLQPAAARHLRTPYRDDTPVVELRPWLGAVVNKLQAANLTTLGAVRAAERSARLSRIPGIGVSSEAQIAQFLHAVVPDFSTL